MSEFKTESINPNQPDPNTILAQAMEMKLDMVIVIGARKRSADGDRPKVVGISGATVEDFGHALLILQGHGLASVQGNFGGPMSGPDGAWK